MNNEDHEKTNTKILIIGFTSLVVLMVLIILTYFYCYKRKFQNNNNNQNIEHFSKNNLHKINRNGRVSKKYMIIQNKNKSNLHTLNDYDETPHVPNLYKPRKSIFDNLDINLEIIEESEEMKRMSLLTNEN